VCGRFTLTRAEIDDVAREVGAVADAEAAAEHRPRWNIAPTDQTIVVVGEGGVRKLTRARWGMGERRQINWRAERKLLPRRCLVPADGFYEWRGKQPIWFHDPGGRLLLLAGLYEETRHGLAFAVVTGPANPDVEATHDRMPVLIPPAEASAWLAGEIPALPPPPPGTLATREVSPRVGNVRNDDPELLKVEGQLDLLTGRRPP